MKTIYKYEVPAFRNEFEMPKGAEILTVQAQNDTAILWAIVDTSAGMEKRIIVAHYTGHDVGNRALREKYIATVQYRNGVVVHFFVEAQP